MTTSDRMVTVAWTMHCDDHGLGMEVDRHFMLLEEFACFGLTNLDTGKLEWQVRKYTDADAAQAHLLNLTEISEEWGCHLSGAPRWIEGAHARRITRKWLEGVVSRTYEGPHAGLDSMLERNMRDGQLLEEEPTACPMFLLE